MTRKVIGGLIQCPNPLNDESASVEMISVGSRDKDEVVVAEMDLDLISGPAQTL